MKYTPGPWKYFVNVGPTRGLIVECDGSTVCELRNNVHDSRFEANARLMSRAPEMFEALLGLAVNGNPSSNGDWACRECKPHSDMLQEGFQCSYHKAIHIIAEMDAK